LGLDANEEVTFLYVGKSIRMTLRTMQHNHRYENTARAIAEEPTLLYRLARTATQVFHLPLLTTEPRDLPEEAEAAGIPVYYPSYRLSTKRTGYSGSGAFKIHILPHSYLSSLTS
jgi:hypothetical protein